MYLFPNKKDFGCSSAALLLVWEARNHNIDIIVLLLLAPLPMVIFYFIVHRGPDRRDEDNFVVSLLMAAIFVGI